MRRGVNYHKKVVPNRKGYKTLENKLKRLEGKFVDAVADSITNPSPLNELTYTFRSYQISAQRAALENKKLLDANQYKYKLAGNWYNIKPYEEEVKKLEKAIKDLKKLDLSNITNKDLSILNDIYSIKFQESLINYKPLTVKDVNDTLSTNVLKGLEKRGVNIYDPNEVLKILHGRSINELYDDYVQAYGGGDDFYKDIVAGGEKTVLKILDDKVEVQEEAVRNQENLSDEMVRLWFPDRDAYSGNPWD